MCNVVFLSEGKDMNYVFRCSGEANSVKFWNVFKNKRLVVFPHSWFEENKQLSHLVISEFFFSQILFQFPTKKQQHFLTSLPSISYLSVTSIFLKVSSHNPFTIYTILHCPLTQTGHCPCDTVDKGTSMSTPTVWQPIIMSGHRLGQRGKVKG